MVACGLRAITNSAPVAGPSEAGCSPRRRTANGALASSQPSRAVGLRLLAQGNRLAFMLIYWQTVLIDERTDRNGLRWPPSWAAGKDYIHRTGPVLMRSPHGQEYLTTDVVYADLENIMSIAPTNKSSPLHSRPSHIAKRLYPLDPHNRSFSFTVTFQIPALPEFLIQSKMKHLPQASNSTGLNVAAEDIAMWVADLQVVFRPQGQTFPLYKLGEALGSHLRQATLGNTRPAVGEGLTAVGNSILLSAKLSHYEKGPGSPDLVVDRPPGVHGRPFIAICNTNGSSTARRRLRTYSLRTFAEIEIADYLYGHFKSPKIDEPGWLNQRARISVDYLSRSSPYGLSGEEGRKMWQLTVSRPGITTSMMRRLAHHRLSTLLPPVDPAWPTGSIVIMENNYTFNGPVGAAGTNAHGILVVGGSQINAAQLAKELQQLSSYLLSHDSEDLDGQALAAAAQEAEHGDLVAADSRLRRISQKALTAANDLALAVAGAVIAHSIGMA